MQIRLGYSRKKTNRGDGGLRICIFEKTLGFLFFYFTLGNSGQNKAPPPEIPQNYVANLCYIPWKFQGQNPRFLEIPHDFFLVTSENSTSFLIIPEKFQMQYLQPTPPFFFIIIIIFILWNSPLISPLV